MLYGKKPNASDKFFPVPNVIFNLGLEGGEILVPVSHVLRGQKNLSMLSRI